MRGFLKRILWVKSKCKLYNYVKPTITHLEIVIIIWITLTNGDWKDGDFSDNVYQTLPGFESVSHKRGAHTLPAVLPCRLWSFSLSQGLDYSIGIEDLNINTFAFLCIFCLHLNVWLSSLNCHVFQWFFVCFYFHWNVRQWINNTDCFVRTKLYLLSKCTFIQQFIRRVDYLFYQNLVEVLIPDVLRPIPSKWIVSQQRALINCGYISAFDSEFYIFSLMQKL